MVTRKKFSLCWKYLSMLVHRARRFGTALQAAHRGGSAAINGERFRYSFEAVVTVRLSWLLVVDATMTLFCLSTRDVNVREKRLILAMFFQLHLPTAARRWHNRCLRKAALMPKYRSLSMVILSSCCFFRGPQDGSPTAHGKRCRRQRTGRFLMLFSRLLLPGPTWL